MSQQLRAAALLRQAAELLDVPPNTSSSSSSSSTISSTGSTTATNTPVSDIRMQVSAAARGLFGPYRGQRRGSLRQTQRGHGSRVEPVASYWTHKFSIIPKCTQDTVPNREEKFNLHSVGLGEKRLSFVKSSNPDDFKRTMEEAFPKLKDCGGYELLRTPPGSRISLEPLIMPSGGFTTAYLADESSLGQAVCYVRPIQRDLEIEKLPIEPSEPCQECLTCGNMFPINLLRNHVETCHMGETDVPPEKKRRIQTPVCQFSCTSTSNRSIDHHTDQLKLQETGKCPLCQETMSITLLETHAACCGEDSPSEELPSHIPTFEEELTDKLSALNKTPWNINVVRRLFLQTAMEELSGGLPKDFERCLNVHFIGEEGVDGGGLTREFFTLLFEKTGVFEEDGFSYDADLLEKKEYHLLGKATALAIVHGHPGPRRLNKLFIDYILNGAEPGIDISDKFVRGADVKLAIEEITTATEENINKVFDTYSHLLSSTGYKKLLTVENKEGALLALKSHFSFFRFMVPLLQFMEGLKLHGILTLLQQNENECRAILGCDSTLPSSMEVQNFFTPSFSQCQQEKEVEEIIVYNFSKFLKKVERETISTPWFSIDGNQEIVTLNLGHVLQSLIGCPVLSKNIANGMIEFDHRSQNFSYVNTCAPSICFCKTNELVNYDNMEKHMMYIIVEAEGFGIA